MWVIASESDADKPADLKLERSTRENFVKRYVDELGRGDLEPHARKKAAAILGKMLQVSGWSRRPKAADLRPFIYFR